MELIINTYGAYLHVKDEMFEVKIRLKDVPTPQIHYFAVHKVKTILLSMGTALSSDAVRLAMKNNVDIVFLENDGHPIGRVWHSKFGSTTKIRKRQLEASLGVDGLNAIKEWLTTKLDNQKDFIKDLLKHRPQHEDYLKDKIQRIEALSLSIKTQEGKQTSDVADTIRGLEGTAGRLYFETLTYVLPKEHQFEGRSSRPAKDAFNAFLNYAYGVLYSKVERSLIIAGLDPYVGFMHRDDYNQLSFVYDFIEPFRTFADNVVFKLFSAKKVNKTHTTEITNGVSLNKEGKVLLMNAFSDYMNEDAIRYKGRNQTRTNIIQQEAHAFAQQLIETTIV